MKSVVIIPARYKSSRFPGKPLANLLGRPMILWVAGLSAESVGRENVYVATESRDIYDTVKKAGFRAVMTSDSALTGTDRIAEASEEIEADIYINVQGDEPLLNPVDINRILEKKQAFMDEVVNGFCWISADESPENNNIPKVITNETGRMVYMSRRVLPGFKEPENAPAGYRKQVCIYAFTRDELREFKNFGRKSYLESCEDIEILRFLEMDKRVLMVETGGGSLAVDVPEDIGPVETAMRKVHHS